MKNAMLILTVIILISLMWYGIFENNPITMIIGSGGMFLIWISNAIKTHQNPSKK
jgi:hypothetical protein